MLKWLGKEDAPLLFRIRADMRQWLWGLQFLRECTPVRMDLTHSAWSDIFFLGMDFPEGAKVLDATGKWVIPGALDVHVRLDHGAAEPGRGRDKDRAGAGEAGRGLDIGLE